MTKQHPATKHDRRQAFMKAQEEARRLDPRPSEEIVREMRDEWEPALNGEQEPKR